MNENLKGVKKNNVLYQCHYTDPETKSRVTDFLASSKKGYVNWPLACSSDSKTAIDHLPTGLHILWLTHATGINDTKKYIDHLVNTLGVEALERLQPGTPVGNKFMEICQNELPEEEEEPEENIYIDRMSITNSAIIKRQILKGKTVKIVFDNNTEVTVDTKVFIRVLTSLSKALLRFTHEDNHELITYEKVPNRYAVREKYKKEHNVLKIYYDEEGIRGEINLPEVL